MTYNLGEAQAIHKLHGMLICFPVLIFIVELISKKLWEHLEEGEGGKWVSIWKVHQVLSGLYFIVLGNCSHGHR
jgi:hypothetical protein